MKRRLFSLGLLGGLVVAKSHAEEEAKTAIVDDLEISISPPAHLEPGKEIRIHYAVANKSQEDFVVTEGGFEDRRVVLVGPGDEPVIPYPYDFMSRRFLIKVIKPGGKHDSSFPLDFWFPLERAGEYRCTYTQRVYHGPYGALKVQWHNPPETLKHMDLVAPEIRFRVPEPMIDPRQPRTLGGLKPDPVLDGISRPRWYEKR